MKIVKNLLERMTLEQFANKHELVMEIYERPHDITWAEPFYANFVHAELAENGCLVGAYGNGYSPEDAIKDYAKRISGKRLVLNAFTNEKRKEILVPILIEGKEK
jgi:hypothetical protein